MLLAIFANYVQMGLLMQISDAYTLGTIQEMRQLLSGFDATLTVGELLPMLDEHIKKAHTQRQREEQQIRDVAKRGAKQQKQELEVCPSCGRTKLSCGAPAVRIMTTETGERVRQCRACLWSEYLGEEASI